MICPYCERYVRDELVVELVNPKGLSRRMVTRLAGRLFGSVRTQATAAAARENGKKGGRPRKR